MPSDLSPVVIGPPRIANAPRPAYRRFFPRGHFGLQLSSNSLNSFGIVTDLAQYFLQR
jgi:hypothetical protein